MRHQVEDGPSRARDCSVWVFAEHSLGQVADVGLELLSRGRALADRQQTGLAAVLLGHQVEGAVERLYAYGADRVYLADDPALEHYQSDAYVEVLQRLIEEHGPETLLFGATMIGLDLAPSLAARLESGLAAHCIDLDVGDEGYLAMKVPAFGHASVATIVCSGRRPQMATVRPGAFSALALQRGTGELARVAVELRADRLRARVLDEGAEAQPEATLIEQASVVVAGGAGIGSAEGWGLVEELARALGGAVGASRPAVDAGWANPEQMVGHSGKSVRPKLYVAVGISGDMLHMIGVKNAQFAVAINSDPQAPIFKQVDWGLVGDYRRIVPLLAQALHGQG